jgi:hypothetical protein
MATDFVKADPLAAGAAAAAETLAKMTADHAAAPAQQLTRARARQGSLPNDVARHLAIEAEIAQLEAKARGDTGIVLSDAERLDLALGGQIDHLGAETTVDGQLSMHDLSAAVAADLALGVPRELLKSYHLTGRSGDEMGHVAADIWIARFRADEQWQRRFAEGDPEIRRRYRIAHIYLAGAHTGISPQAEADFRARYSAY